MELDGHRENPIKLLGIVRRGYWLTLVMLLFFAGLGAALWWSRPPVLGVAEPGLAPAHPGWRIGYFAGAALTDATLQQAVVQQPEVLFFAGPAPEAGPGAGPAPRTFFPVLDGTRAAAAELAARFPHLPADQLPGYGRTAYFVDYGNARFWFLDAARLATEPAAQLDWLARTAAELTDPAMHRIVLLREEPAQPEVWRRLAASGADLVLIGARLYAPEAAVTDRPAAGYRPSAHQGWAEWTVSSSGDTPPPLLLTLEGRGSRLAATDPSRPQARLAVEAAGLRQAAAGQDRAPVAIGATWRYTADGAAVRAGIPPQQDPRGEEPIAGRFQLPPGDWRSPVYDDAGWKAGPAPFGRSQDSAKRRSLRTPLEARPESPTVYFRKSFVLDDDPARYTDWQLQVAFEDGYIAYLNGTEIARDSIREGWVNARSLADPHEGGRFEAIPLGSHRELLVKGVNTLAVEVHTSHPDAPEMWFDLTLTGKIAANAKGDSE
ncbi:hypothetical protein [Paenibacillus cremeus]|uniref:Uncharacterized protein n=1 Tax=Paenibacillus cremeus TaxID=2163881 RepID=A0A559K671_9BACL|nr:hypothetical protein [Paenibacillus cremeus]TVY07603.1 hypothetical protein FPZ49_22935 [Paenibacillus cremeus]